jgi:hypothetical protein
MSKIIRITESKLIDIIQKIMLNQSIISEVEEVDDFDKDFPEYNYSSIKVLPSRRNPNEIGTVFFNGKTFGRSEYHDPEYNTIVKFNGPLGEFKFDSGIVRYNGNSPYVFGNDLNHSDYYKLLPLMAPTKTQVSLDNIISSSDNITSSSDNITSSSDKVRSDNKLTIDQYKTQVQNTLKEKLSSWITNKSGLHLSKIIDDILKDSKTKISDDVIEDNIKIAKLLFDNKKIKENSYEKFISDIKSKELIYDENGNWLPINKLNANYSEVSKLLTDLLFDSYLNNKDQLSKEILIKLIYDKNDLEIKSILLKNKEHLIKLLNSYRGTPDIIKELDKYTSDIITLSNIGEETENNVVTFLEQKGWEMVYQGGNGDFIDMLFSVDLIFRNDTGLWTFQVKSSKKGGEKFIQDVNYNSYKYGAVDYLIYPVNGKFKIYNLRKKEYE